MKQFIIIGNSAAGIAAVEAIRKKDQTAQITVVSDEGYSAYCRCLISYYLAKEVKEEKLFYRPESFYKENNITLILNKKVTAVLPKKNLIVLEDKNQLGYDALLIATGAAPKIPEEIKGIKKPGVFGFRTLKDAKEIEAILPVTKTICVLGGGLIGLKAAYALSKRKIEVKIIIKSQQVLSQVLDSQAAGLVQERLEENGIEVILGQDVTELIGEGDIKAIKLESGKAIAASLVIIAKGVAPNIDLIKGTEIKVNEGIVVSNLLQTNIPNIYAAGDVCESFDLAQGGYTVNALWPVAVEQGRIAGANLAGEQFKYDGSLGMNSLEFFGLPTVSLGVFKLKDTQGYEELKTFDPKNNCYKKLILQDSHLVGAVLAGKINQSGLFLRFIREKTDILAFKERLLAENFGYPEVMGFLKSKEKMYV